MSSFVPILIGERVDRPDEQDTLENAWRIAKVLADLNHTTEIIEIGLDLSPLTALAERAPFAVFNLIDSIAGDTSLIACPCQEMDRLGLRYTGAKAAGLQESTSKLASKARLRHHDLPTPPWWIDGRDVPAGVTVIVKSDFEHGSLGIDEGSVVFGDRAEAEIKARQTRFGGQFFAEAFLEGREFNVAILERNGRPEVLPVPEMVFGGYRDGRPLIMDFNAKWDPADPAYTQSGGEFGVDAAEPDLAGGLRQLALACWQAFGLSGYARVDIRLSEAGQPFVIDINANPCLAPEAGFARSAVKAGLIFEDVIYHILRAAAGPLFAR